MFSKLLIHLGQELSSPFTDGEVHSERWKDLSEIMEQVVLTWRTQKHQDIQGRKGMGAEASSGTMCLV